MLLIRFTWTGMRNMKKFGKKLENAFVISKKCLNKVKIFPSRSSKSVLFSYIGNGIISLCLGIFLILSRWILHLKRAVPNLQILFLLKIMNQSTCNPSSKQISSKMKKWDKLQQAKNNCNFWTRESFHLNGYALDRKNKMNTWNITSKKFLRKISQNWISMWK